MSENVWAGVTVRAPGKLFLLGEYAVLDGGVALLAAVGRHARATLTGGAAAGGGAGAGPTGAPPRTAPGRVTLTALGPSPTARVETVFDVGPGAPAPDAALGPVPLAVHAAVAALRGDAGGPPAALAGLLARGASLTVDTRAFSAPLPGGGHAKLGLGSSAAASVAAAGAALAAAGLALDAPEVRARLVALCVDAHTAAQGGRGSGADVAACVTGGVLAYRRDPGGGAPLVEALPARALPPFAAFWTGEAASSPALVAAVQRWAAAEPDAWRALRETLAAASAGAVDTLRAGAVDSPRAGAPDPAHATVRDAFARAAAALDALGRAAGVPIVVPAVRALAAAAADAGLAAKPSGAGGGDLALVLGASPGALPAALAAAAAAAGLVPVPLALDEIGVAVDHGGSP